MRSKREEPVKVCEGLGHLEVIFKASLKGYYVGHGLEMEVMEVLGTYSALSAHCWCLRFKVGS